MAKIAQAEELLQKLGSISFQRREIIRHVGSSLCVSLRTNYDTNQGNITRHDFSVAHPLTAKIAAMTPEGRSIPKAPGASSDSSAAARHKIPVAMPTSQDQLNSLHEDLWEG